MYGFLHFPTAGVILNVGDIIAAHLDETADGKEFVTVDMRRPNTFYTIHVDHEEFWAELRSAVGPSEHTGLMDC